LALQLRLCQLAAERSEHHDAPVSLAVTMITKTAIAMPATMSRVGFMAGSLGLKVPPTGGTEGRDAPVGGYRPGLGEFRRGCL
jgi:hypothetical protein